MNGERRFCVIGGGRIGLPIAVTLASMGETVKILDLDSEKCQIINNSETPFFEEGMAEELENAVSEGLLEATNDSSVLSDCNVIISAIGTGVSDDGSPEVSGMDDLVSTVSRGMKIGDLFLLKTTLPIGTTEIIARKISENTGLSLDEEILVAFCPERIVEGRAMEELRSLPKIVGGVGPNSTKMAKEVMSIFGGEVIEVSNSRTAEMCKLIDNSYRMTRFGFSADVAAVSWRNDVDAYEAIRAANNGYSRNDVPLPAIGVSGYCLTKDPYYLDHGASELWTDRGFPSTWIAARKAADFQVEEAIARIGDHFENDSVPLRVVIAGVTYKENVDDIRLSHGRELAEKCLERGWEVIFWDPVTSQTEIDGIPVHDSHECINGKDCLVFTVPHQKFKQWTIDFEGLSEMEGGLIFDGWGIIRGNIPGFTVIGTGKS